MIGRSAKGRQYARGRRAIAECQRSGQKMRYRDLVEDGHVNGLLVHPTWWEPKHPQEIPVEIDDPPVQPPNDNSTGDDTNDTLDPIDIEKDGCCKKIKNDDECAKKFQKRQHKGGWRHRVRNVFRIHEEHQNGKSSSQCPNK